MSDTMPTAEAIVADAQRALDEINDRIATMREQKVKLSKQVHDLLDERKPLVRIVAAAHGRKVQSNGDVQLSLDDE